MCDNECIAVMWRGDGACGIIPFPGVVCILCVQFIADYRRELADPHTSGVRREYLKEAMQDYEYSIRSYKQEMVQYDAELAKIGKSCGISLTFFIR